MKLIIQVPCYNESESLPAALAALPREVPGFDTVESLVIDDGSGDGTAEVARAAGANHVVCLPGHQGLARAFLAGVLAGLERGADVIVNTDADNQYDANCIPALVAPILAGAADLVVGARPIASIRHFSPLKRFLQRLGSRLVRVLSGVAVDDAPCGFRALSREAALRVQVFSGFSYTLETLIQAGVAGRRVVSVPVRVNGPTRPSRLARGSMSYVWRSGWGLLSVYATYRPFRVFGALGLGCFVPGLLLALRYGWLMAVGEGRGHIQFVIASGALCLAAVLFFGLGVLAHLLGVNRRLLEDMCYGQRKALLPPTSPPTEKRSSRPSRDDPVTMPGGK